MTGDLDIATTDQFVDAVGEAAADGGAVVVDMGGCGFLDAAGARALLAVGELTDAVGVDLAVVHLSPMATYVLGVVDPTQGVTANADELHLGAAGRA